LIGGGLATALAVALVWSSLDWARETGVKHVETRRLETLELARRLDSGQDLATAALPEDAAAAIYDRSAGRVVTAGVDTMRQVLPANVVPPQSIGTGVMDLPISDVTCLATLLTDGRVLVVAFPASDAANWWRAVAAYQALTLAVVVVLVYMVARRLRRRLAPTLEDSSRREEDGRDSTAREAEFVVETFQSVIGELRDKGRELEQQHRRERDRAERTERFSAQVIDQMPAALVVFDANGRVTAANSRARKLFSRLPTQRDAILDRHEAFAELPELALLVDECLSAKGDAARRETELRYRTNGVEQILGVSVSPITTGERGPAGALVLITDLTEIVQLQARVHLQENLANLGEMSAGLAHELRNSLATIQGYAQLIAASAHEREAAESLVAEVRELTQMVTDFLSFARPQELSLSPQPLAEIVEAAVERVADRAAEAGIDVSLSVAPEAKNVLVDGDETWLTRAFLNLVTNAVEALERYAGPRRVAVSVCVEGEVDVRIDVRDTGAGIPDEDLERVFIPFFTTKSRGYGIGLALTQKILVSHHGRISASNDNGAVFSCWLPVRKHADT
jgi:PAS domain S-box-containing protein